MTSVFDEQGNVFKYDSSTGLITKNDVIVSSEQYEPLFLTHLDGSMPPEFTGVWLKMTGQVLGASGKKRRLINSKTL